MVPEPIKAHSASSDGEKQKQLDLEIRDMIFALTNRLTNLQHAQKVGGSSVHTQDEDHHGLGIITLAGNNVGATMRGEIDEKPGLEGMSMEDHEAMSTYVNSNFQAVNNSIMLGGSYTTNDPGVHMEITDYMEPQSQAKHGKKNKKKEKTSSKSDRLDEQSG